MFHYFAQNTALEDVTFCCACQEQSGISELGLPLYTGQLTGHDFSFTDFLFISK
jgi:hypothetical protein